MEADHIFQDPDSELVHCHFYPYPNDQSQSHSQAQHQCGRDICFSSGNNHKITWQRGGMGNWEGNVICQLSCCMRRVSDSLLRILSINLLALSLTLRYFQKYPILLISELFGVMLHRSSYSSVFLLLPQDSHFQVCWVSCHLPICFPASEISLLLSLFAFFLSLQVCVCNKIKQNPLSVIFRGLGERAGLHSSWFPPGSQSITSSHLALEGCFGFNYELLSPLLPRDNQVKEL